MADKKIANLVNQLIEKSREGKVPWEKTISDDMFQATFSQGFSLQIFTRPSRDDLDYVITILNESGETVEEFSDVDLSNWNFAGVSGYQTLKEIHTIARRTAMGAERAIDAIMADLQDDTNDGHLPSSLSDEDIPF
jgi:Icc-related predicted phosphoesterase